MMSWHKFIKATLIYPLLFSLKLRLVEESNFAVLKKRYKIFRPETVSRKLGLIVGAEFPVACLQPFPLHTLSGKVEAQLEFVRPVDKFPNALKKLIVDFQTKVIPDVLMSDLPWTSVDTDSTNFLIVPIKASGSFDDDCLHQVLKRPIEHRRGLFDFKVKSPPLILFMPLFFTIVMGSRFCRMRGDRVYCMTCMLFGETHN